LAKSGGSREERFSLGSRTAIRKSGGAHRRQSEREHSHEYATPAEADLIAIAFGSSPVTQGRDEVLDTPEQWKDALIEKGRA
jgi:hypothetical protein